MCRENQKLELNLSQSMQVASPNVSVPAHKDPRLESVSVYYESVNVTAKDNPAIVDNPAYCTNNPVIEDNPAYCTSGGPSLSDNPAYIAMKSDPVTTAVSHHSSN